MTTTAKPLEVVQAVYGAFGRGDVAAIVAMLDDAVEWKFLGTKGLPYTGTFKKGQIAGWFASIPQVEDVEAFEPREFIAGGEHVTVLGWERTRAKPGGKVFETDWAHVFTVHNGKITRFWGMYDTEASAAARR